MRTLTQSAILQVLADAAGQPVTRDHLTARAAALLAPVTTVETEADHPAADIMGTDYAWGSARRVTRAVSPGEIDPYGVQVQMLREEGWVITRSPAGLALAGRSCLTAAPSLSPPPAGLPGDMAGVMRLWLLSGGRAGRHEGSLGEWAGRVVCDTEFAALAAGLRGRGYVLDCHGSQGDPVWRITGTPDVPVQPPPPPGSDVRMIPGPGEQPPAPVGLEEMAARLGVKRATADTWRQRGVLPEAWWLVGGRPAWPWQVIEAWAWDTGRLAAGG